MDDKALRVGRRAGDDLHTAFLSGQAIRGHSGSSVQRFWENHSYPGHSSNRSHAKQDPRLKWPGLFRPSSLGQFQRRSSCDENSRPGRRRRNASRSRQPASVQPAESPSFFVGALTSNRFLTVARLHVGGSLRAPQIQAFEVDSTGTTELTKENSLKQAPAEDQIELSLPVAPDADLDSERLLFGVDDDYHALLETYGSLIRVLHHARTSSPQLMGWWSWTAYYFGLNEGTALTNANWLAQHLKPL